MIFSSDFRLSAWFHVPCVGVLALPDRTTLLTTMKTRASSSSTAMQARMTPVIMDTLEVVMGCTMASLSTEARGG